MKKLFSLNYLFWFNFFSIFAMIEMVGNSASLVSGERQTLTKAKAKSMEEMVIEKGVLTVVKALVRNCSTSMYKVI